MKKLAKIFTLCFASLACAGALSAAVVDNNIEEKGTIETREVKADSEIYPSTIYFAIVSAWDSKTTLGDYKITITGGDYSGSYNSITALCNTDPTNIKILPYSTTKRGFDILQIKNTNPMTSFRLQEDGGGTNDRNYSVTITVPTSVNGIKNFYIISSNYNNGTWFADGNYNQFGGWTYFNPNTVVSGTKTLYIVPCYDWCDPVNDAFWEYSGCWPYLVTNEGEYIAAGVLKQDAEYNMRVYKSKSSDSNKKCVFYFPNVPTSVTSMTIYHSHDSYHRPDGSGNPRNRFSISGDYLTAWNESSVNLFYTTDSNDPSIAGSLTYYGVESKTYLEGTFSQYSLDEPTTIPSSVSSISDLTAECVLDANFDGEVISSYSKDFYVSQDDTFNVYHYDYLNNTSSDNNNSTATFSSDLAAVTYANITVFDGSTDVSSRKSDYITYENGKLVIQRGGVIRLSRTSSETSDKLTITFLDLADYLITKDYDGYVSNVEHPFAYNSTTDKYEVVLAAIGSEQFLLKDSTDTKVTGYTFVSNSTGATKNVYDVVSLSSSTCYYIISWYTENKGLVVSIDFYTSYATEACAESLAKTIESLRTCLCGNKISGTTVASRLVDLYEDCTYNVDATHNKDYLLENYTFDDYLIDDYHAHAGYEDCTRNTEYNALYKYQYINWLFEGGSRPTAPHPNLPDVRDSEVYKESNTIIVIIVAATSLVAIASLAAVNFLAIKKRKQKK